jgi:enamine deaminase RidA (YjgF/YER057c/UK114 family)
MAMTAAQDALKRVGLELRHVLYARLFVRSLVDYAVVNAAYRGFFALHPPSRCAVEACLGARDTPILLELLASPLERSVLHVQSVSCWAPSNIGPYSQASTLSGVVFLAGVIALDPPTMQIVHAQSVAAQTRRCLQSCSAILSATRSSLDSLAGAVVYHTDHAAHEVATELARGLARESAPPALLVRVPALPRAALVEIELVALEARLAAKAALVSHALPSRHPAAFASLAREAGAVFALALVVIDAPELVASAAGSRELSTLADETARAVRDVIANNAAVLARHLVSCQVFFRADLAATNFEAELRVAMERAVGSSCVSATPVLDVAVCDLRDSTKTLRRGLVAVRLLAMDTAAADVLVAPRA